MKNINEFLEFATSLKLIRRAEIEKNRKDIIDSVYTDLLPENGVLQMVNLPRTTILKGRKGTGKSTIFDKSQKDMLNNSEVITIYIDVKTLYDNATPNLNIDCDLMIFKGNISCYILLLKSPPPLENTKFIADELSLKVSLVLYLPTRHYKP